MFEESRLQLGDALDMSRPTCVRHQPHAGDKGEPDEWTNQRPRASSQASADPFIAKGLCD